MYLHEEYIKRHGLDIPVIRYDRQSSVFLRSDTSPYHWYILACRWHDPDRHPGFFDISLSQVIHDGQSLDHIYKFDVCYWDEYERYIFYMLQKVKRIHIKAIEAQEQTLAAWQIFLLMFDTKLANVMSQSFLKLVGATLDKSLSLDNRTQAFDEAQILLSADKKMSDVWNYQLLSLAKNNSEWLVRLIND